MITTLSIIGTRPEGIKMAPLIKELDRHRGHIRSTVCVTGQHGTMLDQVLDLFSIRPDFDLDLMRPNQSLTQITTALLQGLEGVLSHVQPDWVLAQGDTTTAMVAGLISFYHRLHFGHVEAGLRTGDKFRPFPEEVNRRIADFVADAYFAPTERARQTLLKEGVDPAAIIVTGNTVVDALLDIASRPFDLSNGPLATLPQYERLVLITAHRRESFGQPFRELCEAIRELAGAFAAHRVQFVYPVHLNPNVREPVTRILSGLSNVSLIEPVDYLSMVHLMKRASLILTDSGGVQEEAPSFGVPVLVMRETTERPEGVEAGFVRLVGTERSRIVHEAQQVLNDPQAGAVMKNRPNPYGDGKAAGRIVDYLLNHSVKG